MPNHRPNPEPGFHPRWVALIDFRGETTTFLRRPQNIASRCLPAAVRGGTGPDRPSNAPTGEPGHPCAATLPLP